MNYEDKILAMKKEYSIGELAAEFNVTTRALRFYEEKGLLEPGRDKHKRMYSTADRVRLKLILRGKRLGFSLEESAGIIKMYDPQGSNKKQMKELIIKIQEKRKSLQAQQKDLELMLVDLSDAEQRCLATLGE